MNQSLIHHETTTRKNNQSINQINHAPEPRAHHSSRSPTRVRSPGSSRRVPTPPLARERASFACVRLTLHHPSVCGFGPSECPYCLHIQKVFCVRWEIPTVTERHILLRRRRRRRQCVPRARARSISIRVRGGDDDDDTASIAVSAETGDAKR